MWIVALLLLAVLGVAVFVYFHEQANQGFLARVPLENPGAAAPAPEPSIRHPLQLPAAPVDAAADPLPALDQSDATIGNAISALIGRGPFESLVRREGIIRRIVATLDNLPRTKAHSALWPVRPAAGTLGVSGADGSDGNGRIDPKNSTRYAVYMTAVEAVNPHLLVESYVRLYPLFQRAYEELGFPNGYFNDRLMTAIDDLLQTPDVTQPIAVTRPKVLFEFADPDLESLSAGQKMMLRIGPANAAIVKDRLRKIRAELARRELGR